MKKDTEIEKLYYLNEDEIFNKWNSSDEYILKSNKAEEIEEVLRKDLINYFGTATNFVPMAMMGISKVENADEKEKYLILL